MKMKRSIALMIALLIAVTLFSLSLPQQHPKPKKLKVLPKNISHEELDTIMKNFKNALGVKCSHCHVPSKDDPKRLDFASDENEHKQIARDMMRMTMRINKKYFRENETMAVTCYTCHRGNEQPLTQPTASNR